MLSESFQAGSLTEAVTSDEHREQELWPNRVKSTQPPAGHQQPRWALFCMLININEWLWYSHGWSLRKKALHCIPSPEPGFNEDADERSPAINTPQPQESWRKAVWREAFQCCQAGKALCVCGRGDNLFYWAQVLTKEGQQGKKMARPSGQVQQKLCKLIIFTFNLEQLMWCLINYRWHKRFWKTSVLNESIKSQ